jgi:hypothetical protein
LASETDIRQGEDGVAPGVDPASRLGEERARREMTLVIITGHSGAGK